VNVHHTYVRESIPVIEQFAAKVARVHGVNHPETISIQQLFLDLKNELVSHMQKEETVLFPYIKKLQQSAAGKETLQRPPFNSVANPIRLMESEHELAGSLLKQIASATDNFTPPTDACNTYRVLYHKLEEFQNDLFQHIHLENNILFPKALLLESQLMQN
jgi:regulator of cell morphogenesis and NO signaling